MIRGQTDIISSILAIKSDAEVTVHDNDINTIIWHDSNPTNITNKQITDKQKELQTDYDNKAYARKRAEEYPSLKEFAEAYCEKEIGGDETKWNEYKTKYNKVRSDNPKESS